MATTCMLTGRLLRLRGDVGAYRRDALRRAYGLGHRGEPATGVPIPTPEDLARSKLHADLPVIVRGRGSRRKTK